LALDRAAIERLIDAAGYDPLTPVAVGVSLRATAPLFVSRGDDVDGATFGADSLAYAASLAKQMTGACAALLARDGTLDVEATIDAWLPELPGWSRTIRVRHLLHHTSGLPGTDTVCSRMESRGELDWTSDGVIEALTTMIDLEPVPGTEYAYSGVGYVCLARIVERLSGQSLDRLTRRALSTTGRHSTTPGVCGPSGSTANGSRATVEAGRARPPRSYDFRIVARASPRLRSTTTSSGWSRSQRPSTT